MTEAVQKHILGPMMALYPPPQHLRRDASQQRQDLAEYTKALARFDEPILQAAWQTVVSEHAFWVWPNPGTIVAACCRHLPPPPEISDQELRRQRAMEMADLYVARFMKTTQLARLATSEGWSATLREYVHDAAWVQTQLICGVQVIGFASTLVPEESRHLSAGEFFKSYRETLSDVVERGTIRVSVPSARRREWKAEGSNKRAVD